MEAGQACVSRLDFGRESKLKDEKELYKIIMNNTILSF
jgi:hypothetical protein